VAGYGVQPVLCGVAGRAGMVGGRIVQLSLPSPCVLPKLTMQTPLDPAKTLFEMCDTEAQLLTKTTQTTQYGVPEVVTAALVPFCPKDKTWRHGPLVLYL
jgi:hypothetical protein